jgi:hypothetical protein
MYKLIDTVKSDYLELGDLIKNPDGDIIEIKQIEFTDSGYFIHHLDDFDDEMLNFLLLDNVDVDLYWYDDE